MKSELINRLSGLSILGYYDDSLKMLCVQFFDNAGTQDFMAYLLPNLSWDLREVISETTELLKNKQVVVIKQKAIDVFVPDSWIDKMIRSTLKKLLENENFKNPTVLSILQNGYEG